YSGFGGKPVAQRSAKTGTAGTTVTWVFSGLDGTVDTTVVPSTGVVQRSFRDPFGVPLGGASGVWGDGTGFLGKPVTDSSKLTTVGARTYDPVLGKFTSVDPVTDPDNPQQNLGYAYSGNNPITFSDPTGLIIDEGCGGWHVVCGSRASTPPTWEAAQQSAISPPVQPVSLVPRPIPGPPPVDTWTQRQQDLLNQQAQLLLDGYSIELDRMFRASMDADLRKSLNGPVDERISAVLRNSGVSCAQALNGLNVCHVDDWPSGGTTIGEYFITQFPTDDVLRNDALLAHEQAHSQAWAGFGPEFGSLYIEFEIESNAALLGSACGNYWEYIADFSGGNYFQC
ncbi:MAG: RHS repeat-associated core domain-containing protein, partial [Actinobacteria bacterium]|nr:RHS repeat-associated core domain-containing protein [Actinomycetota bacterium]